jgi:hypothetical protein
VNVVVDAYHPSTQETKSRRTLSSRLPGLHSQTLLQKNQNQNQKPKTKQNKKIKKPQTKKPQTKRQMCIRVAGLS